MNPYQKYMQQSVTTMTPAQLLIALYDKMILELNKAIIFIDEKDIPKAHNSLTRAGEIVDALDAHLKVKYEISDNLATLYQYFREKILEANMKKNAELIKEILPMIQQIRDAFEEAGKIAK